MDQIISFIDLQDTKDFMHLARQFRKVNDVIFKEDTRFILALRPTHLVRVNVPHVDDRMALLTQLRELDFLVPEAKLTWFTPTAPA